MSSAAPIGRDARGFRVAVLASLLLACSSLALAQKTDVVVLKNGDRITGEVKGVDRAQLELSTDTMRSIYIEIEEISEITAQAHFEVEDTAGRRYYGTLRPAGPGRLGVMQGDKTVTIDLRSVVRLWPIRQSFLRRLDGSIDLGASYTQSSGIGQGTFSAALTFRRPSFEASTRLDTTVTVQSAEPATSRNQLQVNYTQLLPNRWIVPGIGQFESNVFPIRIPPPSRAARRHSAARLGPHQPAPGRTEETDRPGAPPGHGDAQGLRVAGQRPGTAERDRAGADPHARRHAATGRRLW
jgi:hypothetical protein